MALVPASSGAANLDEFAVKIEPAQRRLANIQTAPVERRPLEATIQTVGSIAIDESRQATIAAYIDGRLERLFADRLRTTIGDLYVKIRLDRARTLVHETALPLLEIAVACGFATASHFSRAYRARFRQSPRKDREAIRVVP